jgi:hypothetical protein
MLITIIVEKKRIAAEQLSAIERQFQMFKDRQVCYLGGRETVLT